MREVSVQGVVTRDCPQPIVLVSAYTPEGKATAMPTGWAMRCSASPFLYAVALHGRRYTLDCLRRRQAFGIAFPSEEQEEAVAFCGEHSGRVVDKEERSGFTLRPGAKVQAPLIAGAVADLECRLIACHAAGDHFIVVGEIVAGHVEDRRRRLFNFGPKGYAAAGPLAPPPPARR